MDYESYICQKEIDWSVLHDGFTLPYEYQVKFYENMDTFMERGDKRTIIMYLESKIYEVKLYNVNNSHEKRKNDCYQIRYSSGSDFAIALRAMFHKSFAFFDNMRKLRSHGDKTRIILPENMKEYIAIYTTEYPDTFVVEPIFAEDIADFKQELKGREERSFENELNVDAKDVDAGIVVKKRNVKLRKLNKKIGDNLKLLYGYKCQICGKLIGEEFGCSHTVESHHIDYFVNSLNNDAKNQIIVCPNHHSIIHEVNPKFDRCRKLYLYKNGMVQKLILNKHL